MSDKQYTLIESKKIGNSEYELRAEVPAEVLAPYRAKALKQLGADTEIPGFRKGHIPEEVLMKNLGEPKVLERAANLVLADVYPKIIADEKLQAIGSPRISITKLAAGNPLEFTATTAVLPEVKLPNYTNIAKEVFSKKDEDVEVTEKDLEETLTHIRRQRAQIESFEKQKKEGKEATLPEIKDEDLPELTNAFVQTLGDFATVEKFKDKVKENILEEKKLKAREKKRIEAVEKIIAETKVEMPEILIEQEVQRIHMQLDADVARSGAKLDDYLKQVGKTLEDLREEWRPEGEKRAKLQLILHTIAKEENIAPNKEDVESEIQKVLQHYPEAQEENVRTYVVTTKGNEAVFTWLEEQGK